MRKGPTVVASVLAGVALTASTAAALGSDTAGKPRVRMLDAAPLTLRGLDFEPRERVRVTVTLGTARTFRGVEASPAGAFTILFRAVRYGRCGGSLTMQAMGSKGSRATWELTPLECPNGGAIRD